MTSLPTDIERLACCAGNSIPQADAARPPASKIPAHPQPSILISCRLGHANFRTATGEWFAKVPGFGH